MKHDTLFKWNEYLGRYAIIAAYTHDGPILQDGSYDTYEEALADTDDYRCAIVMVVAVDHDDKWLEDVAELGGR